MIFVDWLGLDFLESSFKAQNRVLRTFTGVVAKVAFLLPSKHPLGIEICPLFMGGWAP